MVYYDSQLFSVDGVIQTVGASYTIDLSDLMYCILSTAKDNNNDNVDTFFCMVSQPNRGGITRVQYRRNGRTVSDFLSDMNAIGGGEPLKLWTNLRSVSGKQLFANNILYDSTVILNDNFQSNCVYSDTLDQTLVYIGNQKQISPTSFLFSGNQIGSAPPDFGGVNSIVAGSNITVDDTDPANPIISATGGSLPYSVYTANMTCTGAFNPTTTILQNTIGNIVWIRLGAGRYLGSLASAFPNYGKVAFFGALRSIAGYQMQLFWVNANAVEIDVTDLAGTHTDAMYGDTIEIRVYP